MRFNINVCYIKTMEDDKLLKKADLQGIAEKGARIYEKIKAKYERRHKGKFLAIEVDGGSVFIGKTSAQALILAREKNRGKIFYVVKIGFDVAETLAEFFVGKKRKI